MLSTPSTGGDTSGDGGIGGCGDADRDELDYLLSLIFQAIFFSGSFR